jgi:hypothetical protein
VGKRAYEMEQKKSCRVYKKTAERKKEDGMRRIDCGSDCVGPDCEGCRNYEPLRSDAVSGEVPSLQEYLIWAEDGLRTHEEIYDYFARFFA